MDCVVLGVVGILDNCCFISGRCVSRIGELPLDVGVNIFGVLDYIIDTIENAKIISSLFF